MRFKEADIESSGCNAQGKTHYRKTAVISAKNECPSGKLRCCMFCDAVCTGRCGLATLLEKQPDGIRDRYDCINLRPSMELAWQWLGSE